MSDSPSPDSDSQTSTKRKASTAGLNSKPARTAKRRASKACQCCRARKVRCNVVEHGAPCTNCRLDEVECIVTESKRKRKSWPKLDEEHNYAAAGISPFTSGEKAFAGGSVSDLTAISPSHMSFDFEQDEHVPHTLYQTHGRRLSLRKEAPKLQMPYLPRPTYPLFGHNANLVDSRPPLYPAWTSPPLSCRYLPYYINPLPPRIGPEEAAYLENKNVLTVPDVVLRNELLQSYVEHVHPFMPLLDVNEFLETVEDGDGRTSRISLLLFQAVMFAGSAFVSMRHLRNAGYLTRREARKAFYLKARLLYDFDYEVDRVSLVQSLLLMTYWYETPDDQKDTWHWMGVATSLAQSIGLHRNPANSNMDLKRQRLWKRIWWSCYMRDRLIALGMRRPTRIKDEDFDVPMLSLDDFDLTPVPDEISCISTDCDVARDADMMRALYTMCIQTTKLCQSISRVLSTQYAVVNQNLGMSNGAGTTRTTSTLIPKRQDPDAPDVKSCHDDLEKWLENLPESAKLNLSPSTRTSHGQSILVVHRALLHMIYYTTLSALHRPQVLPSAPALWLEDKPTGDILDLSRASVRLAASEITRIGGILHGLDLVRFLPTTGVTVLLPAIIIHLLDIKSPAEEVRRSSLKGFCQCMQVMAKLRESYASADFSMAFLEAAIRKADIQVPGRAAAAAAAAAAVDSKADKATAQNAGNSMLADLTTLTPPPEPASDDGATALGGDVDDNLTRKLEAFLASTPPESDHHDAEADHYYRPAIAIGHDFDAEFGALVDFGKTDTFVYDDGGSMPMQGESSGFAAEMDFMKSDCRVDGRSHEDAFDEQMNLDEVLRLEATEV